jgi:UDPglucose 6-dehydrogenase
MKVAVFGTGYVGLVTGACLAEVGHHVVCVDVDLQKITALNSGIMPIFEPGIDEIIARNRRAERLSFTGNAVEGVAHGDIIFIAVGTPPDEDGSADLQYVLRVATTVGQFMASTKVVVNKSTVPVGTGDLVAGCIRDVLARRGEALDFAIVSNPEFLKEGDAVADFMLPDRIVLGVDRSPGGVLAEAVLRELYAPIDKTGTKTMVMDIKSAELTKYAANAMLATRISFMNQLANLAEDLGADIESVRIGIGSDSRIGSAFLRAGTGYGGSCFPKDVQALIRTAAEHGHSLSILREVESANERQKTVLVRKLVSLFGDDLSGKLIAIWGLAFKPNTDDMRDAPSIEIVRSLIALGAAVCVHDPVCLEIARAVFTASLADDAKRVHYCDSPLDTLSLADALIVVTEWDAYRAFTPDDFVRVMPHRSVPIIDGRALYSPTAMHDAGLHYLSIGRPDVDANEARRDSLQTH